jgi:antitoxin HicB
LKKIKPIEYYLNLNYPVTLYHAEEGGYVAEIEDLPGCLTEGETLEEVTQKIDDARKAWIQTAYEDGIDIPLPRSDEEYSGKFMVRIPNYLHRRLVERARREGASLNQYVESILSAGVATQNVIAEIKPELDKISKQIAEQETHILAYPASRYSIGWMAEESEQEALGHEFSIKIKDMEKVAA